MVVANPLHREIVEALLAAGKHVLCEKPLAPSVEDGEAMLAAADAVPQVAAIGFNYRRVPAIAAVRQQLEDGALGRPRQFNARFWCDYASDPDRPMSWRYKGGPGSGALADLGSHLIDLGEFLCGPIESVRGALLSTFTTERPTPLGSAVGHATTAVGDVREPVENEDLATFTVTFASGRSARSRRPGSRMASRAPWPSSCSPSAAPPPSTWRVRASSDFIDGAASAETSGYRQVFVGPQHPYFTRGLPMDFQMANHGLNDLFVFQARAFLEQVAGIRRPTPMLIVRRRPPQSAGDWGGRRVGRSGGAEIAIH